MSVPVITLEQLLAYAAGELDPQEKSRIDGLLKGDPASARALERIEALLKLTRQDDSVAPPEQTVTAAQALFREHLARQGGRDSWLDRLQRIVAERVFDSGLQPALRGVRGATGQRQVSFESVVADVDLEITARAGENPPRIRGQIDVHGGQRASGVALARPGEPEPVLRAEPDAQGGFSFAPEPGHYSLIVTCGETALELPDIDVE